MLLGVLMFEKSLFNGALILYGVVEDMPIYCGLSYVDYPGFLDIGYYTNSTHSYYVLLPVVIMPRMWVGIKSTIADYLNNMDS